MTERELQKQVIAWLKQRQREGKRLWWLKVVGSPMQARGMPDFILAVNDFFLAIELKTEGKKLTRLQEAVKKRILPAGRYYVLRSVEEVEEVVLDYL
jgi:hypothetical protein